MPLAAESEMVVNTASPSAAPICCDMLISADTTPARFSATLWTAVSVIGTKLNPKPNDVIKSAGMMCQRYEDPTVSVESQYIPDAAISSPGPVEGYKKIINPVV
jgi:hypothetical protein